MTHFPPSLYAHISFLSWRLITLGVALCRERGKFVRPPPWPITTKLDIEWRRLHARLNNSLLFSSQPVAAETRVKKRVLLSLRFCLWGPGSELISPGTRARSSGSCSKYLLFHISSSWSFFCGRALRVNFANCSWSSCALHFLHPTLKATLWKSRTRNFINWRFIALRKKLPRSKSQL